MNNVVLKFVKENGEEFYIGSNYDWRFTKNGGLSGFGLANGDLSYTDNVMADGGQINRIRYKKVDRTVNCVYINPAYNKEVRNQFLSFFTPRTMYKVYLTYMGNTRWARGVLYKMQASEDTDEGNLMKFKMTFAFASPFWMSVDDFGKDIAAVTGTAGFPYLCQADVGCPTGIFNFAQEVHLTNNGDVETYPKVYIIAKDDVTNPVININDGFVRIIDELVADDEIEIDFTAIPPTVKKNGVNAFGKCDRESDFFAMVLKLGDNVVSFDADNGSDEMIVTIYYNKLYTVV